MLFTKTEISGIRANTQRNYHSENMYFIARRVGTDSDAEKIKKINEASARRGHLTVDDSRKQYMIFQGVMKRLKKKSPEDYKAVQGAL